MEIEGHDSVKQALLDYEAGPVKKSLLMSSIFVLSIAWIVISLVVFTFQATTEYNALIAYTALSMATLSPVVGIFAFFVGYLRRYRYLLGKTIQRLGVGIIVGIPLIAILLFGILK